MSRRPPVLRFPILAAISLGLVFAQAPPAPATLVVNGDIAAPLTLKAEDLAAMPREKASIPEQDGTEVKYEGVPLREVLLSEGAGEPIVETPAVRTRHDGVEQIEGPRNCERHDQDVKTGRGDGGRGR